MKWKYFPTLEELENLQYDLPMTYTEYWYWEESIPHPPPVLVELIGLTSFSSGFPLCIFQFNNPYIDWRGTAHPICLMGTKIPTDSFLRTYHWSMSVNLIIPLSEKYKTDEPLTGIDVSLAAWGEVEPQKIPGAPHHIWSPDHKTLGYDLTSRIIQVEEGFGDPGNPYPWMKLNGQRLVCKK